jgi:hypothetical protein
MSVSPGFRAVDPEDLLREVERLLNRPDLVVRFGWQDPCRIADRHPADGHRCFLWKLGEEVHGRVDPHLGPRADDGPVEYA